MSVALVKNEILTFLKSSEPGVLCVRGKWGVGKTFAWSEQLKTAHDRKEIALTRYSYVSLFGINSLDELKLSIFENVVALSGRKLRADLNTLDSFITSNFGSWRKPIRLLQSIPGIRSIIGGEASAIISFLTIRDQIICFDDLERRGQRLDIRDVLGLVSLLREQRGCKVVIILNDEALSGDEKTEFQTHLEKVVDISLVYGPTASESVSIALDQSNDVSQYIGECCGSLGIANIRVIKRIESFVRMIEPLLIDFDKDVFRVACSSLVLFCWARDQPGEAPTLDFLTSSKARSVFGLQEKENLSDKEAAWSALLAAYGYTWTDDFSLALIEGVWAGFFDPVKIENGAKDLHNKLASAKADGSFEDAWRLYHDSFSDNADEVLDAIYASFMNNYRYIAPLNLNGTVALFKDLGRNEQALEMIRYYVENRDEPRSFFDLERDPFSGDINDIDVLNAFAKRCAVPDEALDISTMLLRLKESWNDEILAELAAAKIEEYKTVFKETSGTDLRRMIAGVLQFDRINNASAVMKEISRRAKEALKLIGAESPINARRVAKFGIVLEVPTEKPPA